MDTLSNLKAMIVVSECGSFSGAARRIGVGVSVIKKRVDQLEAKVGTRLFVRSTRSMTLTDAGRLHMPQMRRAVDQLEEALVNVAARPARLEGRLRIKAPTTLMGLYMGDMLNKFLMRHPDIDMDVVVLDRAVNPVLEGFDVAIGMLPATYSGVLEIGLCAVQRIVVASRGYIRRRGRPKSPSDLDDHDILNYEATGETWNFEGSTGPIAIKVTPKLSSNHGVHLLNAARAGNGIACLSSYIVMPSIEAGELEPLLVGFPVPEFWIRMQIPEERASIGRVQALATFLQENFVPLPPWHSSSRERAPVG